MSGGEEASSKGGGSDECGLFLGCWDNEGTFVQDLERTVNSVERKCKKLFEELIYYKKYLEKSEEPDLQLITNKKKSGNSKKSNLVSGSEPDIAIRKNLINSQEIQQVFEDKFQEKLCLINKELQRVAHKMGLKEKIILLGTKDRPELPNAVMEDEAEKRWADVAEKYVQALSKAKAKSNPAILDHREQVEFSRITKNELELYQKLSKLNLNGRAKKKKLGERKLKFCHKRKTFSHRRISSAKTESEKSRCPNKLKKKKKSRTLHRRKRNCTRRDFFSADESRGKLNGAAKEDSDDSRQDFGLERTGAPLAARSSTSRGFDWGFGMQQLLSLSKRGKKVDLRTFDSGRVSSGGKNQTYELEDFISPKKMEADVEKGHAVSRFPSDYKNCGNANDRMIHAEHEKLPNLRKVRSRYTGSSPEGLLKCRKFTGGQKSTIKSEWKTACADGSKTLLSDCRRNCNSFANASGDGGYNKRGAKSNAECTEVYGSFLNMFRYVPKMNCAFWGDERIA